MKIIASSVALELADPSGRAWATETHIDDSGQAHVSSYLWDKSIDANAVLASRAVEIEAEQSQDEQTQAEQKLAAKQVATVLDAAIKDGKLTEDDVKKAGYEKPADVLAAQAAVISG